MKTATMPPLRVEPELRQAAEEMLEPGETLSGFVEESLRRNVERRQAQRAFIERGLASRDAARKSGQFVAADVVLARLADRLDRAAKAAAPKSAKRSKRETR